jgi:hypothetical protein
MWRNQSVASLNALLGIVKGNALLVGFFYSQCLSPRKNSTSLSASVSVFDLPSLCHSEPARGPITTLGHRESI